MSQTTLAGTTSRYAYAGDKLIGEFTPGGSPINKARAYWMAFLSWRM